MTAPPESATSAKEKKATRSPPCPVVPMTLTMGPGGRRMPFMSLDDQGDLRTVLSGGLGPKDRVIARLDPRGCVAGDDGVWVERTRTGTHWTLRGQFDVQGARLMAPRPLEVQSNGDVYVILETAEASTPMAHFDGYRPEGECAALLLLTTWLSMMPSMAVVDGSPIELPPPDPSVCPDLHQR